MRGEQRTRILRDGLVVTEDLHALVLAEGANDLGIDPGNRTKLARPVRLVVRPGDPRCVVLLPLGRHPARERQIHSQSAAPFRSGAFTARACSPARAHPM
jgi:hypothetical protein